MKKRGYIRYIIIAALAALIAVTAAACDKNKDDGNIKNGVYCFSVDGSAQNADASTWIIFSDGKTWSASDGYSGNYEGDRSGVILRYGYKPYMTLDISDANFLKVSGIEGGFVPSSEAAIGTDLTGFTAVSNEEELAAMKPDGKYYLTADIDMSMMTERPKRWTPLFPDAPFTGIFDGNGHTIANVIIETSESDNEIVKMSPIGLFAKGDGCIIRNVNLKAFQIISKLGRNVPKGLLIGSADNAAISNISVMGVIESQTIGAFEASSLQVGGLAGRISDTALSDCTVQADITYNNRRFPLMNAGGVAGYAEGAAAIRQCATAGLLNISQLTGDTGNGAEGKNSIGGILGRYKGDSLSISSCHSALRTQIRIDNQAVIFDSVLSVNVGGILGSADILSTEASNISMCYFDGDITVAVMGRDKCSAELNVAGIAGKFPAKVTGCYFAGNIVAEMSLIRGDASRNATLSLAGISGYSGSVKNCLATGSLGAHIKAPAEIVKSMPAGVISFASENDENCASSTLTIGRTISITKAGNAELGEIGAVISSSEPAETVADGSAALSKDQMTTTSEQRKLGFATYKNIAHRKYNPSAVWRTESGALPALFWES